VKEKTSPDVKSLREEVPPKVEKSDQKEKVAE
jgi:hypothetical protein